MENKNQDAQNYNSPISTISGKGIDTVSYPSLTQENTAPFMLNFVSKEGFGLKRRDGLALGIDLGNVIILGSYSGEDESVYFIVRNGVNLEVKRLAGNQTILTATITSSDIPANTSGVRFKIIDRYPSTTNNIFIYGQTNEGGYFNLQSTLANNVLAPFVNNTTLTSTTVSGVLKIVDHDYADNRLFTLVFDEANNRFVLLYSAQQSTALNSSYILPNNIRGRGTIIAGNNVFVFGADSVFNINFSNGFNNTPTFSRYINNAGLLHPWAYAVVDTIAYCASKASIYRFSTLTNRQVLGAEAISSPIDTNISNLYPTFIPYRTAYKHDEKSIYFTGIFNNSFTARSIFIWLRESIGTTIAKWEDFYTLIENKVQFTLVYNIVKDGWYLLYFDTELVGIENYFYKFVTGADSEFIAVRNDKILHMSKEIDEDDSKVFPVGIIPCVQNKRLLTEGSVNIERVSLSSINTNNNEGNIVWFPLNFGANISRVSSVNGILENNVYKTEVKPTQFTNLKASCRAAGYFPAIQAIYDSKIIDIYFGSVVNSLDKQ